ncbi:MAG TPA: LemA family protein [Bacillota bacterium]|jgi:LemA protein|nr:LemA family protein [Bacillota bacterium]HOJ83241.1 LemA family protein [Bacillota bacterium]HOL16591.1 LemA family protein [Bacillota bacterium]HPZ12597.1 LemA family protein [Bacillota bacterium]HQE11014.1 LemA family protein [Bacillota bacterium]
MMWWAIGIIAILAVVLVSIYNRLVTLRQRIKNAWAQIEVQLKRRYDLIPNLVSTVKGYAAHEKETFERVVQARNAAISAQGVQEQAGAENMLSGALRQLFALVENYPELKANTNFMQLQEELTNTEGKIAFSRQFYNDTVLKYNTAIQRFPAVMVAGMFGFHQEVYFNLDDEAEARQAVKVEF